MSGCGLIYRLIIYNPKIYASKFVTISMFMNSIQILAISLEYVSPHKRSPSFTHVTHMQAILFYFISYRYVNLNYPQAVNTQTLTNLCLLEIYTYCIYVGMT